MEKVFINRSPALIGNEIQFENEQFFGLQPGSEIIQIGNGKENGTIRTDKFVNPIKYVGSIEIDGEKKFAFHLPSKMLEDKSINHYLLYFKTEYEIGLDVYSKSKHYVRWYKPEFKF